MSKKSNDVVITAALRTPIGTYKGSLKGLSADKLGALAIKEAVYKSKLKSDDIDEVIMGHVLTSGLGQNPARQASIHAGIPVSKPAHIINQVCGSGLRSVISGYQSIKLQENKIIVAGGQENMSRAPHAIFYREDKKLDENKLVDTMINDGLIDSFNNYHMGITAENVAEKYKISRDEQDLFALNSQEKTQKATNENRFKNELIKLKINTDDKNFLFEKDEHPRNNLNLEDLKKLNTVFKENGTVTAGNSSGINDGAAATILMSREEAELRGIEPLAKVVSWATCGVEPSLMGLGPIKAVNLALEKAEWKREDIDLFEINEAFAAQSIAVIRDLKIRKEIVNVNGGAIALGHPIGASGTRILVTLIHEMIRQNKSKGCATLCIGGGMGIAMCIERN
ncbi:Acetyl-CoA acetyltransferase [Candidatus Pelagibacter ubique HTCC1002]|uniref:Acetyl-CoA acetyltransferase n=2 Tax=Pelagibacter ubique (strain HTCC1002) TaxID=314261 RepID=Q1V1J1_PELU1|nr:acetyl-CoA C-acetyltransferase [Candidatus Pelagibacter ubique]EAS84887.1 Acetyl-CoA acetyltransferase [Candidatus Pelagibacter ubique HTCC1002]